MSKISLRVRYQQIKASLLTPFSESYILFSTKNVNHSHHLSYDVPSEMFTDCVKITVFWNVTPCALIDNYQRFGGIYDLGLQDR
jgi:hypothetical protein